MGGETALNGHNGQSITGDEDIDGVRYYLAEWVPTLVPIESLGKAPELVAEYEDRKAKARAYQRVEKGQKRGTELKQCKPGALCGQQEKKRPSGRLRKQRWGSESRGTS
jgi:hypothetical protein